jgi:hypothetical protein
VEDAICKDKARDKLIPGDMAFGVSWGISRHYRDQVEALKSVPEGEVGEAVFKLDLPPLAQSTWYIFQVGDVPHPSLTSDTANEIYIPRSRPFLLAPLAIIPHPPQAHVRLSREEDR